jgi:uncharacterized protein YndB with AHSA1/START domain
MESMPELTEAALVAAPIDVVWRDWTGAVELTSWLWPPRFEATAAIEPIVGGEWTVRSAPTSMAILGEVVAVDAPRELRIAWRWQGDEHASDVTVSLEPAADDSTRVTVHHTAFASTQERDDHIQGWTDCLDRLVARHA